MPAPYLLGKKSIHFPNPTMALADPNGLLAIGGDLKPERLIAAYRQGIFPWYSADQPILWWSPDPRAIILLDDFKISRSLAKILRKQLFTVTFDHAFAEVVTACSMPRKTSSETWILSEIISAYSKLHDLGFAHSVEVWQENELVGGLYGVSIGKVFTGESMFSQVSNASKIAMVYLVKLLKKIDYAFIDCQIQNHYLESLGAIEIPRSMFLELLAEASEELPPTDKTSNWRDISIEF